MSTQDVGVAREALDRALAARPRIDAEAMTEATKALCRLRDTSRLASRSAPGPRTRLKQLNGLVTLVHGAHYPLSAIRWDFLEQARQGVDVLAAEDPAFAG